MVDIIKSRWPEWAIIEGSNEHRPTLTGIGTVLLWAALLGGVRGGVRRDLIVNWLTTVFPWKRAQPERQSILVLGAAALVALGLADVKR